MDGQAAYKHRIINTDNSTNNDYSGKTYDILLLNGNGKILDNKNSTIYDMNSKYASLLIDLTKKDDGMDAATNQKYLDAIKNIANDSSSSGSASSGDTEVMTSFSASNDDSASGTGTGSSGSTTNTYTEGKDY